MKKLILIILSLSAFICNGQNLQNFSFRGEIELPIQLSNDDFKNFTESVINLDLGVQYPIWNGLGLGIGGKGALNSLNRGGDIFRSVVYGKAFYEKLIGPATLFEANMKVGLSTYHFQIPDCPDQTQQTGHFDPSVSLHFFANDYTSFGMTVGYEIDTGNYGPELVCANPDQELYSLTTGFYRYLSFGLGFNILFGERTGSGRGVFN